MVAGVCGGLGRYIDVDPVIYRVLVTVLSFFGGAGLLFYALAWLFLPGDRNVPAPVPALFDRSAHGRNERGKTGRRIGPAAVLVILVAAFFAVVWVFAGRNNLLFLTIGAALGGALIWHASSHRSTRTAGPAGPGGKLSPRPAFAPHGPWPQTNQPSRSGADTPQWTTDRRTRDKFALGPVVIVLALIGIAAAVALNIFADAQIGVQAMTAGALGVIGAGLVVGGFIGQARWLIAPGIVLALVLIGAGFIRPAATSGAQPTDRAPGNASPTMTVDGATTAWNTPDNHA